MPGTTSNSLSVLSTARLAYLSYINYSIDENNVTIDKDKRFALKDYEQFLYVRDQFASDTATRD